MTLVHCERRESGGVPHFALVGAPHHVRTAGGGHSKPSTSHSSRHAPASAPRRGCGGRPGAALPPSVHPSVPPSLPASGAAWRARRGGGFAGSGRWGPGLWKGKGPAPAPAPPPRGRRAEVWEGAGARCHGSLQALPEEIVMPVTEGPLFLLVGV